MALNHLTATLSTTAQKVLTLPTGAGQVRVYFQNADATNDIYVGAKGVTTSGATQGLKIGKASLPIEMTLDGGDVIYAIGSAGTPALTIVWTRN
jgi:hypothetical protein